MTHYPLKTALTESENATITDLLACSEDGMAMFQAVSIVAEHFSYSAQAIGFAVLFGILGSLLEGMPVPAEQGGQLITFEDRLQLFVAQARAAFKDASAMQQHPDYPKTTQGIN